MDYHLFPLPDLPPFVERSKEQSLEYFQWYKLVLPNRVEILENAVITSVGSNYRTWKADKTFLSLDVLNTWFLENIGLVQLSSADRALLKKELRASKIPIDFEFIKDNMTVSIILDIGMYLGEVFRYSLEGTRWKLCKQKQSIDYNQPILTGIKNSLTDKKISINPTRLVDVLAAKHLFGGQGPINTLKDIYNFYSSLG
jgi:hypothetical protein